MITRVYIQKMEGQFANDYTFAAAEGFNHRGLLPVTYFEDIMEVPKSRNNMVVGFVEDTRAYFKRLGITEPTPMGIPKALECVVTRKHEIMSLDKFLNTDLCPVFVKPYNVLKGCSSGLIAKDSSKRFVMSDAPTDPDFLVFTSEPVEILDEYRCFIHNGKVVGVRHYNIGNGMNFPSPNYINRCVSLMNEVPGTPCAYTLDVMVLRYGKTQLIECNDFWSVGSYGLDSELYAKMLKDRWEEILRRNP